MSSSIKKEKDFETISTAFSKYNLGVIKEEHQQIKGDVDINYKITATSGIYLLKYIENKINIPQFEMLGHLHEYLREKGILVPKIYKNKNGNYLEDDFILYEFIDGETKEEWSKKEMVSLVSNFAKMLIVLKDYAVPDFVKNKNDKYVKGSDLKYCHDVFRPQVLKLSCSDEIKIPIIKIIDLMYSKLSDFEKLPKFLTHGDLNEMNAIFKDGTNVAIIDFGIGYDPTVYDLGEFCYWFCMPLWGEEFNNERYNLILKTFNNFLPLSNTEKELLPYMILRRGMMDLMLTLQWYWANPDKDIPEKRLALLIKRNNKIINLIKI
jgi:Ser/Thr protein kinase RdoA (MazF antagonist)